MNKDDIKKKIGIYSAAAVLMAIIIPVSVLANISKQFPEVSSTNVQLLSSLPSLLGIVSNLIISKQAHKIYKRYSMISCTILYIVAGVAPYFYHSHFGFLLFSAAITGFALGGIQNGLLAQICDYFEGKERTKIMGFLSLFVGLGGMTYAMVSSKLGAVVWYKAYLTYLIIVPLLILQIVFLPKGILEEKPTKTNRVKVSKKVIILCCFGFVMYTCNQLFNSNISMLVVGRTLGGVSETGNVTAINTIAGMLSGVLILPFARFFKKYSMTITFVMQALGCLIMAISGNLLMVCVGGFLMAMSYGLFTPLGNQAASEASNAMGLAFNMALISGISSLGAALSPYTTSVMTIPFGGNVIVLFALGSCMMTILAIISIVLKKNDLS